MQRALVVSQDDGTQSCAGVEASVEASTTEEFPQAPVLVTMPALLLSTRVFGPSVIVVTVWQPAEAVNEA